MPAITVIIWLDKHKIQNAAGRKNSPNCPCRMICVTAKIIIVVIQTGFIRAQHWEAGALKRATSRALSTLLFAEDQSPAYGKSTAYGTTKLAKQILPRRGQGKMYLRVHLQGTLIVCMGHCRKTWEEREGRMVLEGKG